MKLKFLFRGLGRIKSARAGLVFLLTLSLALVSAQRGPAQEADIYELAPINYSKTKPHDAVTRLQTALLAGQLKLTGTDREIVQSLLRALHIPPASQLLVFSKTSFQKDIIGPEHPRALFYTDDCYVGWVPDGLVEIAAIDPVLGPVFYSFDPRGLSEKNPPEFTRENECLRCHGGNFVPGIPSVFARSLYPDKDGEPIFRQGSEVVDYQTPFSERWGGWYVTGRHGDTLHRGNTTASELRDKLVFDPVRGANITNLSSFFTTNDYLAGGSDIVSLLVFEHQLTVQNALTQAGINCRRMLDYQKNLQAELKEPALANGDEFTFDSVRHVFDHSAEAVVDALLSKDEAPLPETITGSPEFPKEFAANVPRARDGSSLKDLLVSGHLYKNRCSYLIYSESFRSLPPPLQHRIYARLAKALNALQPDPRYSYIPPGERKRITEILRETVPGFRVGPLAGK